MAGIGFASGNFDKTNMVCFKLLDTSGTPSITEVFPPNMASNVSVVDTATGRATITIANFKGDAGFARVFLATDTTSTWGSVVTPAFSGFDFSFELSVENDASSLTDTSVNVLAISY